MTHTTIVIQLRGADVVETISPEWRMNGVHLVQYWLDLS